MLERTLGNNRCTNGSPFHTEGPTTENARAWLVEVRAKGTKSNPRSIERRDLLIIAYCSRNCSNIGPHTFEIVHTSVTQCHIELLFPKADLVTGERSARCNLLRASDVVDNDAVCRCKSGSSIPKGNLAFLRLKIGLQQCCPTFLTPRAAQDII